MRNYVSVLTAPLVFVKLPCAYPGGGGGGVRVALKKSKTIKGFLAIHYTGPDLLKNHKAAKPEFNVFSSSTRQRFAGEPMMARLK